MFYETIYFKTQQFNNTSKQIKKMADGYKILEVCNKVTAILMKR